MTSPVGPSLFIFELNFGGGGGTWDPTLLRRLLSMWAVLAILSFLSAAELFLGSAVEGDGTLCPTLVGRSISLWVILAIPPLLAAAKLRDGVDPSSVGGFVSWPSPPLSSCP